MDDLASFLGNTRQRHTLPAGSSFPCLQGAWGAAHGSCTHPSWFVVILDRAARL